MTNLKKAQCRNEMTQKYLFFILFSLQIGHQTIAHLFMEQYNKNETIHSLSWF